MRFGLEEHIIDQITKIFEANAKVDKAFIFGSRAKGNYRPDSDVDIAIQGFDIVLDDILKLSIALDEIGLTQKIDLINYNRIKEKALVEHIDRVGVEIYRRWKRYKLKDLTTKIGSGATPTGGGNAYKEQGISLIRSQNILDFKFSYDGLAFIDNDQANGLKNVIIEENDVLLNITGDSVARVCKVPKEVLPARVNQHVSIIRADLKKATPDFLLYYLQSIKEQLLGISEIGGTRNALTKAMIEELVLTIPPLSEQISIAEILSSLDKKIELLQRQNKTLEQLAETLFKQWFVEEIDESWDKEKLGDILDLVYGSALKEELRTGTGFPVVGSSGIVGYHFEYTVEAPGIVIGRKGTLGKVNYLFDNFYPIDTTYFVKSKIHSEGLYYEYFLLKTLNFEEMNSDSAVPGLNRNIALSTEIRIAPLKRIKEFNQRCFPLFQKIKANTNQIHSVTKLRSTILPKLMNGEVRVKI
ncbi:MAG: restriction endonuclease subunit S [Bacteroidetes bacterium]|nr:restriction endonuclease subunit S [Bacteroidota bacterium]